MNYPATKIVHWPTGPVAACTAHAAQLVGLSRFLGSHVGVTPAVNGEHCENCKNEAKHAAPDAVLGREGSAP
jgi:hypothetical protein